MSATLTRYYTPGFGTIGIFTSGTGFECVTIERDWISNKKSVSCIPEGIYECRIGNSSKNLPYATVAYEILNVPNRTDIKIHVANYPHELEGCIGFGKYILGEAKELMVTKSADTILAFHKHMNFEPFTLEIVQYSP
jgi:hypothetical protein